MKTCAQCSAEFTPSGNRQQFCSVECRAASKGVAAPSATKARAKSSRRAPRKLARKSPRKRVSTGYQPPRDAGGLSSAIGHLKLELESLDLRRSKIMNAIENLEAIEA